MNVLLIDDSKTMRNIQRRILNQIGYETVEEARDGQEALIKIEWVRPDLMLVDWDMPEMDGLSFVRQYRNQGGTAMIIMVMSEAQKSRANEAIEAGVNHTIVKPFTPDTLSHRINETLRGSAAA